MAKRLRDVCGMGESEPLWRAHRASAFVVRDLPWTEEKLRLLPHFEFENWAVIALGGIPNKTQVGDMGIDGRIFPVSAMANAPRPKGGELALEERFYPIQVSEEPPMRSLPARRKPRCGFGREGERKAGAARRAEQLTNGARQRGDGHAVRRGPGASRRGSSKRAPLGC
jgi:hypothetical protein